MPDVERHELKFNVLEKCRKFTANAQRYLIDNVRDQVYESPCRERLNNRELYGFCGHGVRMLSGKLKVDETGLVKTPQGFIRVENEPSNVTVALECSKDGEFSHTQEILPATTPGKKVSSFIKSKIGGFSWAFERTPAQMGVTGVGRFYGMDYVFDPGFNTNRPFVLESASEDDLAMVYESVAADMGITENEAEILITDWSKTVMLKALELQTQMEEAAIFEAAQQDQITSQAEKIQELEESLQKLSLEKEARRQMILENAEALPIAIPAENIDAFIRMESKGDFDATMAFFQKASQVDLAKLPLQGNTFDKVMIPSNVHRTPDGDDEYGSRPIRFDDGFDFNPNGGGGI